MSPELRKLAGSILDIVTNPGDTVERDRLADAIAKLIVESVPNLPVTDFDTLPVVSLTEAFRELHAIGGHGWDDLDPRIVLRDGEADGEQA